MGITEKQIEEYASEYKQCRIAGFASLIKSVTGKTIHDLPKRVTDELDVLYENADEYNGASTGMKIINLLKGEIK